MGFPDAFDEDTQSFPFGTNSLYANPDCTTPVVSVERMLELLKRGRPPPDEDGGADERVHFVDVGCGAGAVTNQVALRMVNWRCTGIDISAKQLDMARSGAKELAVSDRVEYRQCDYLDFDSYIDPDVPPHKMVFYMYIIPRMFNATLRKKFSALLEAGAAVVVWHYFPTDWPHLDTHDERFNMRDLLPLSKGEKVFRQNFGSVLPLRDQLGLRHFL